eukprot:1177585-Prorocentrum_minimum.AAC.4
MKSIPIGPFAGDLAAVAAPGHLEQHPLAVHPVHCVHLALLARHRGHRGANRGALLGARLRGHLRLGAGQHQIRPRHAGEHVPLQTPARPPLDPR